MADRRVAVTGVGIVAPGAIGADPYWQLLRAGRSQVGPVEAFDTSEFPSRAAGELKGFSARKFVPRNYRKAVKVMARDIEIAVAAADLAARDAGLTTSGIDPEAADVDPKALGCNIGAGLICSDLDELGAAVNTAVRDGTFDLKLWGESGMANLTPLWLLKYLPNMLSCHVTIIHQARGPSNTITCGAASGHLAAGEASRIICRGAAELAFAGGAESKLNPMGLLRQSLLNRLRTDCDDDPAGACRPFDTDHAGTVIGEGGGLLILEDLERARARGARIYAEVVGFGSACDPGGMNVTERNCGMLDLAIRNALADAELTGDDVDLLGLHGTGVPAEDTAEAAAVHTALGEKGGEIPAFAVTGAIGSLFAGAGGAELVATVLALANQEVPATVNFTRADPTCELNLSARARPAEIDVAVTGAFSVGGQSAAVVLKRWQA